MDMTMNSTIEDLTNILDFGKVVPVNLETEVDYLGLTPNSVFLKRIYGKVADKIDVNLRAGFEYSGYKINPIISFKISGNVGDLAVNLKTETEDFGFSNSLGYFYQVHGNVGSMQIKLVSDFNPLVLAAASPFVNNIKGFIGRNYFADLYADVVYAGKSADSAYIKKISGNIFRGSAIVQ